MRLSVDNSFIVSYRPWVPQTSSDMKQIEQTIEKCLNHGLIHIFWGNSALLFNMSIGLIFYDFSYFAEIVNLCDQ